MKQGKPENLEKMGRNRKKREATEINKKKEDTGRNVNKRGKKKIRGNWEETGRNRKKPK